MPKRLILSLLVIIMNSCIIPTGNHQSKTPENEYILKENFVTNEIGWIEEKTEYHELEIKNGYYFIYSIDTSFTYTSTSPLDKSFLFGLKDFILQTKFELVKKSTKSTQLGIFFISGSVKYSFIFDYDGFGIVEEYNYQNQEETILLNRKINNFNPMSFS